MILNRTIAGGLMVIGAIPGAIPNWSAVTLTSSVFDGEHTFAMPDDALMDLVAIAEHNDGEPEGMDMKAAYARLEPLLVGCPPELRPIP